MLLIAANWTNILAFASEKAAAAQAFLNAVMAANPAALAAAAVLVLVAALYAGVAVMNHFAGTSVSATGIITGAFAVMGAFVFNSVLVPLQNGFAMFANFVGNVFTNPVAAVKVLFYDMAITVLQYMQNIASAVEGLINMIPGVTVDLTSGLGGWITDLAKKRSDEIQNSGYTEYVKPWENMDLGSAYTRGYDWGSNLSLGNLFGPGGLGDLGVPQAADVNSLLNNVGAIKNNTGKIAKTVDLSDEQLKMMVDIAERKFVNNINLTSQAPVITVQGRTPETLKPTARALPIFWATSLWSACRVAVSLRSIKENVCRAFTAFIFHGTAPCCPCPSTRKSFRRPKNPTMASIMCLALALSCSRARQSCVR